LYRSPPIVWINFGNMGWAGHVARLVETMLQRLHIRGVEPSDSARRKFAFNCILMTS